MPETIAETYAGPGSAVLLLSAVGDRGAERDVGERIHGVGNLAAAVRLGGDRVESRQRLRTSGVSEFAGWRFERAGADLRGDADELHSAGFGLCSRRSIGRSCGSGRRRQAGETIYYVPLKAHATAIAGSYQCAYADFTLVGYRRGRRLYRAGVSDGSTIRIQLLRHRHTGGRGTGRRPTSINAFSTLLKATGTGTTIRVYYTAGTSIGSSTAGANGNRFGVYRYSTGSATLGCPGADVREWHVADEVERHAGFQLASGTLTPDLTGTLVTVPTQSIRKMRWTYAADLQAGSFVRSEFQVVVSNWTVTGTNRTYSVAGPGSRRAEDHDDGHRVQRNVDGIARELFGRDDSSTTTAGDSVYLYAYTADGSHQSLSWDCDI